MGGGGDGEQNPKEEPTAAAGVAAGTARPSKRLMPAGGSADGQYEGEGEMHYADGATYKGGWRGGLREGSGTYTAADGAT